MCTHVTAWGMYVGLHDLRGVCVCVCTCMCLHLCMYVICVTKIHSYVHTYVHTYTHSVGFTELVPLMLRNILCKSAQYVI